MSKFHTQYVCQECGRVSARPLGRCPTCGAWDTMLEEVVSDSVTGEKKNSSSGSYSSKVLNLNEVQNENDERWPLSMTEFARVLGGGIVPGSIVLLGGDPGIGKSTLMLQVAAEIAGDSRVLYTSGEESARQIKMRAQRLQADGTKPPENLYLLTETNLEAILAHVEQVKPALLVVDSIQTVYLDGMSSSAGSVSQVRECAARLRELAKSSGIAVFLIGHVTKEGVIAGPRVLEHIVDTVLQLEGDRFQTYRLLRSMKNRFGPTSEVGVFEMREQGMAEVTNPSEVFLAERMVDAPGSSIAVTMEGTRPILVELQGLTSPTSFGNPRRTTNGLDFNRLLLVTAVLTRRVGVNLSSQDIFLNVVGGLTVEEPAADLAAAAAIASSQKDKPVRADLVLIGEVGLSGELRWVSHMELRLREAAKLGFKAAVIPRCLRAGLSLPDGFEIVEARSLSQAIKIALVL
jgi:DNA repair protein RadA/Sms